MIDKIYRKSYNFYMENNNQPIKLIEVGKFYFIHDGSSTGHPGLVVWKDDEKNRYLVIRFDSDKPGEIPKKDRGIKHITRLSHVIEPRIVNSYVKNRPLLCKRKDIGKPLSDLVVHQEDHCIIDKISNREPEISNSLKRKKKSK